MNSFKCSKCSYNTIRNYDLTRHLKRVHGIYVNAPFKGDNQLQAGLPSQMSEEKRHSGERMEREDSEEEPNTVYTKEEKLRAALKQTKCEILDCVLNILPPSLKAEAKRICDLTRDNDRIWINDKKEVILDGRVIPKSNICTLIIEELIKCQSPVNTTQYIKENKLLKYLLAHQTKALERERGAPICKKFKSLFDGTVVHFDDSSSSTDTDDSEEEDSEEDEDCQDEEDETEEDETDEDETDEAEDEEEDVR